MNSTCDDLDSPNMANWEKHRKIKIKCCSVNLWKYTTPLSYSILSTEMKHKY